MATGRLEIQSGLGHRTYDAADLRTARLVPMAPQVSLATVSGFGDLLPLAAHAAAQVGAFAANFNLFYADERGGRFLFVDEPLEWGTRYRLLSMGEITPPSELDQLLDWKPDPKFGGWNSYEIALPKSFVGSKPQLPAQISAFLGRRIRSSQPRIHVVHTLPHHVEVDGTYVYPESPKSILLRRSGPGSITVTTSSGSAATSTIELTDEWVRLDGLTDDGREYTVAIAGNEQVIFRIEQCQLFKPGGVIVRAKDHVWDLFTEAPIPASDLVKHEVRIDCGSTRIAAHIARMNVGWALDGAVLSAPSGSPKNCYAGSFGEMRGVVAPPLEDFEEETVKNGVIGSAYVIAARRWIEDLVAKRFGKDGADRVRRYLLDPSRSNLYQLGSIMTSPLMPYIRAAIDQERVRGG